MFVWIWQLEEQVNKYGSIDILIAKLKSLGINDVCIKFHEGASYSVFRDPFIKYKSYFKNAGFKIGTWGYNYFNNIQQEARIIIDALDNSDYYIFDPEVDVSNKFTASEQVCQLVRKAHPKGKIGYSSFPIVSFHQDIPYSVFNKYCDFASPQAYWGEMQWDINKCIDKMLSDHKYYGLNLPIYPSIQTYNVRSDSYASYTKYGFNNSGAWSLDEMDSAFESFVGLYRDGSTTLQTSSTTTSSNSTIKPSDAIKALQHDLNIDYNAKLAITGIDDTATEAALKGIQNIIVKGHKSQVVQWIQQKLIGYGYLKKGQDTSVYDGATFQAVTNLQKNWGRTTDGVMRAETWYVLLNN